MAPEDINSLPVSVLKEFLFRNHVDTRLVIEKSDLVERVMTLIANEGQERERQEIYRQMEEEEGRLRHMEIGTETHNERLDEPHLDSEHQTSDSEEIPTASAVDMTNPGQQTTTNTKATLTRNLERSSLCVVCQDKEANIAVIDCGHMAMCKGCSDLIFKSTRECPLCRIRIVTEARLLRIFKP